MNKIYILIAYLLFSFGLQAQNNKIEKRRNAWVEDEISQMTQDEKIGQLMMIRAHSNKGKDHTDHIKRMIEQYHVGALCFFQGDPVTQAQMTNEFQGLSKVPLIVAMDAEWGLGMRFPKSTISYPRELTLGAINENQEIYEMGERIAYELKRLGVHMSFSPVVDVNNNPSNPVINNRSFGEDRYNVTAKSIEYMRGLQDNGIIACAKHFPGHGDTNADSHFDLPIIHHDRNRLDSIELYPFKSLIDRGVKSVMIAHLSVPALDNTPNRPTTLSTAAVQGLLRHEMGFEGIVITDAMEMKGVTKHFEPGQADAEAIKAGNDMLCLPLDVPKAAQYIKQYIQDGLISQAQLEESVRRILRAKFDAGLWVKPQIVMNDLMKDLNNPEGIAVKASLFEKAITLATDNTYVIPYFQLNGLKYATVSIGEKKQGLTPFQNRVGSYVEARHFHLPIQATETQMQKLLDDLKTYDRVIVAASNLSKYESKDFGFSNSMIEIVHRINGQNKMSLVVFGSPYALKFFDGLPTVIMAYTDDSLMQDRCAQAIFGVTDIRGRLPVSASEYYRFGQGEQRGSLKRLGYGFPEEVGMIGDSLLAINKLVDEMIRKKAAPGCQVLVARRGKIVFDQAYGTTDYNPNHQTKLTDVYDVASVTKIAAATISVMKLDDQGLLNPETTLSPYIPGIDTSNKKNIPIKDIMAHHAGLVGWIPFYTKTINPKSRTDKPLHKYYRHIRQDSFNVQVASNLYMRDDYVDSLWQQIISSDLRSNNNYKYSDLAFYFMRRVVEQISGMPFDVYVHNEFYGPLGLTRTGFNPRNFVPLESITPSEKDNYFRNQTLTGYVHDMGAAMMGGVSGHAGLFSNTKEMAIIMQMLLNGGSYGGITFMRPETVVKYTTRHPRSTRRAMGFDMKELDTNKYMNMSELATNSTYGHLGFTGTCTFVDPENELIYILLSNRTYPSMENNKFGRLNYRPRIQSAIYNAIQKQT